MVIKNNTISALEAKCEKYEMALNNIARYMLPYNTLVEYKLKSTNKEDKRQFVPFENAEYLREMAREALAE